MSRPRTDGNCIGAVRRLGSPEAALGHAQRASPRGFRLASPRETVRVLNSVDAATLRDLGITDIERRSCTARPKGTNAATIRIGGNASETGP